MPLIVLHHASIAADQAIQAEREAYRALAGRCAGGEWFRVSLPQAQAAIYQAVFNPVPHRIPLTVKVSKPIYERLREAAHCEETDKQDLVDRALDELLSKLGY